MIKSLVRQMFDFYLKEDCENQLVMKWTEVLSTLGKIDCNSQQVGPCFSRNDF